MTGKTLSELGRDALMLASLLEGLDVLRTAADGMSDSPIVMMRARNGLMPTIEAAIQQAWALQEAIERIDSQLTKQGEA
mgnify:CR=1 FL=1